MIWLHVLFLIAVSIGNTELLVTIVNRTHAFPMRERILRQVRHLHDLLIPIVPIWTIVVIGFVSPGVFRTQMTLSEAWAEFSLPVRCYFGLCLAGFVGFAWSVARYWSRTTPAEQTAFESVVTDVSKELGYRPIGNGPFRSLVRVPLNECFQIDWTTRQLKLEGLPREWDGLTILHVTDLHFTGTLDLPFFRSIFEKASSLEFDMAVCTGDLIDDRSCLSWIPETLGQLEGRLGNYFILGNHDWPQEPDEIRQAMIQCGWRDAAGELTTLDTAGKTLLIGGSERPWMGRPSNFNAFPNEAFRLLLSHTPDNLSWACRQRVDLVLAGHNHGGQVSIPGIGPVYSPSLYGCRHSGGLFKQKSTVLFVNRGISGRHPLRFGARPEVARLILRAT